MIRISDKIHCCGCQACLEACPPHCINMVADEEGFFYPVVNQTSCIDCGLCEKICPQLNTPASSAPDEPLACFAAISKDNAARLQSSSGGVFSLLAKSILTQGGVVFGARFDDTFSVFHSYTEAETDLSPFQGSKYVQSDLRGAYTQVRRFLTEKRPVLFTGTPCQIAGLRGFLHNKEDEKLYLVSIICHGVPSPQVWKDYLNWVAQGVPPTHVSMRNKDNGWTKFRIKIQRNGQDIVNEPAFDNPFMKAFLFNLILRPACYSCQFRGNHGSDLSLGDFWGVEQVHPEMSDDRGTSLILAYTEKGQHLLSTLDLNLKESRYEDALKGNSAIIHPSWKPVERELFWRSYKKRGLRTLNSYTTFDSRAKLRKLWARLLRKIQRG